MTPAQKKTSQEHAAKAEAVDMAPGFALYNASLPEKSKKRKHGYTIEEVARKDNDVSDHQDCRDAEEFVTILFEGNAKWFCRWTSTREVLWGVLRGQW